MSLAANGSHKSRLEENKLVNTKLKESMLCAIKHPTLLLRRFPYDTASLCTKWWPTPYISRVL